MNRVRFKVTTAGWMMLLCLQAAVALQINDASFFEEDWDGYTGSAADKDLYAGGDESNPIGWFSAAGSGGALPSVSNGVLTVSMDGAVSGSARVNTSGLNTYSTNLFSEQYVLTLRASVDRFPDVNIASNTWPTKGISLVDSRRDFRLLTMVTPTALWVNGGALWTEIPVSTDEGTFYSWQFEVDDVSGTVDILRRESDENAWTVLERDVAIRNQDVVDQILFTVVNYNADNSQTQGVVRADYFYAGRGLPEPVVYASFDEDLGGVSASQDVSFVDGVIGDAVAFGAGSSGSTAGYVEFTNALSSADGTVMFWMRPDGDDTTWPTLQYNLFEAYGSDSANDLSNQRVRFFVNRMLNFWAWEDADNAYQARRYIGEIWPKGEWRHMAFSWNNQGEVQIYVNGLPYQHGQQAVSQMEQRGDGNVALQGIERFYLGSPPNTYIPISKGPAAFDELKIYDVVLSDQQVSEEFRRAMPADLVVRRRFLRASESETVDVEISQGGRIETPETGVLSPVPVSMNLACELTTLAGSTVCSTNFSVTVTQDVETVSVPVGSLSEGSYRLACSFSWNGSQICRIFPLEVYQQLSAPSASNDSLELGDLIDSIDCSQTGNGYLVSGTAQVVHQPGVGSYREAGTNRLDRFSYEIEFAETNGTPVVIEITWPDDKPRAMGLYMYRHSATLTQNRDRLAGGIQSGYEYPCGGGMTKTRYIFYPWEPRYLFEARTMIPGYPAAVSRIDVYEINGRLPKLSISSPAGETARRLGHMDEDQSFEILINSELDERGVQQKKQPVHVLETLLDYMDYTGQDIMNYAFIRYRFLYRDMPGAYDSIGFRTKGWQHLMLDMFERRDKKLLVTCNATGLPEDLLAPDEYTDEYTLRDRYGNLVPNDWGGGLINPVHPEARSRFLRHINDVLGDVGSHPACAGLDLWFLEWKSPWSFHSLENGYGDYTVPLFESDTGINLGVSDSASDRFNQRYLLLTGTYRSQWLAWRAEKTTELVSLIDTAVRNVNTNLSLNLSLAGWGRSDTMDHEDEEDFNFTNLFYETYSMALDDLAELPSVRLMPQRQPTWYRFQKFHADEESTVNELMWDPDKCADLRATGRGASSSYHRYFESFNNSLDPVEFKSSFQSADAKPHGRYFLQDLVHAVAAMDPSTLLLGGQPLGTSGRDVLIREFSKAYCALPAEAFSDVEGQQDPVVVRYCQTGNGTYLYAANLTFWSQTGSVWFAGSATNAVDLSTSENNAVTGGELSLSLKPFQLRSFLLGSSAVPTNWTVQVSTQAVAWCQERFEQITNLTGSAAAELPDLVSQIQTAINNGELSEAHRLMTSKALRTGEVPEVLPFPSVPFMDEDWNDLDVNAGDSETRIGWTLTTGDGGSSPAVSGGELTVTMVGATGGMARVSTGNLNTWSANGVFPSHYLVTMRTKVTQFPDISFSAGNGVTIEGINLVDIRRQNRLMAVLTSDRLWVNNLSEWVDISVSTTAGTYYTWLFDVDDDNGTVDIYRRLSDTEEFSLIAEDVLIRSQDVVDQVHANSVFYNGDNQQVQGSLVGDYFQINSAPETVLYVDFDEEVLVPTGLSEGFLFLLLSVEPTEEGNIVKWYSSGNMDPGAGFSVFRSESLASGWDCVAAGLPRDSSGTNTWEDKDCPTNSAAFYQVLVPSPESI